MSSLSPRSRITWLTRQCGSISGKSSRWCAPRLSLRSESRGAHQREDFPERLPQWRVNQTIRLRGKSLDITQAPASQLEVAAQ